MSALDEARALFARQVSRYRPKQEPSTRGPKLRRVLTLIAAGETLAEASRHAGATLFSVNGMIRSDRMYAGLYEAARGLAELERVEGARRADQRLAEFREELAAVQRRREEDLRRLELMVAQLLGEARR